MSAPRRLGAALIAVVASAGAAASTASADTLRVVVVPTLSNVQFTLDGVPFGSHGDGVATIHTPPGTHRLRVEERWASPDGRRRGTFYRWLDDVYVASRPVSVRGRTTLQAGFKLRTRVHFRYIDLLGHAIPASQVESFTLLSSTGRSDTHPGRSRDLWLPASSAARRLAGFEAADVRYAVERVTVAGSNVVNAGQQRFLPSQTDAQAIQLLFYSAHFSARDALFGFSVGHGIRIVWPDGRVERHAFSSGSQVRLPSLPRGEYQVAVEGGGMSPLQPLALSRDQEVDLQVLSYLDMAAMAGFAATLLLGLLFAGRPHLLLWVLRRARGVCRRVARA